MKFRIIPAMDEGQSTFSATITTPDDSTVVISESEIGGFIDVAEGETLSVKLDSVA